MSSRPLWIIKTLLKDAFLDQKVSTLAMAYWRTGELKMFIRCLYVVIQMRETKADELLVLLESVDPVVAHKLREYQAMTKEFYDACSLLNAGKSKNGQKWSKAEVCESILDRMEDWADKGFMLAQGWLGRHNICYSKSYPESHGVLRFIGDKYVLPDNVADNFDITQEGVQLYEYYYIACHLWEMAEKQVACKLFRHILMNRYLYLPFVYERKHDCKLGEIIDIADIYHAFLRARFVFSHWPNYDSALAIQKAANAKIRLAEVFIAEHRNSFFFGPRFKGKGNGLNNQLIDEKIRNRKDVIDKIAIELKQDAVDLTGQYNQLKKVLSLLPCEDVHFSVLRRTLSETLTCIFQAQSGRAKELNIMAQHYSIGLTFEMDGRVLPLISRNSELALKLFEQSALSKNGKAAYSLGEIFLDGKIVERDLNKAKVWYEKALALGVSKACERIQKVEYQLLETATLTGEQLYQKARQLYKNAKDAEVQSKAVELYKQAAFKGHAKSLYLVGMYHLKGMFGFKESRTQALGWLKKSAALGEVEAIKVLESLGVEYL